METVSSGELPNENLNVNCSKAEKHDELRWRKNLEGRHELQWLHLEAREASEERGLSTILKEETMVGKILKEEKQGRDSGGENLNCSGSIGHGIVGKT
jgi:hypothetical protein